MTFPEDEAPTTPGRPERRAGVLARLYMNLTQDERHRFALLADAWFRCDERGRELVELVASKTAR